MRFFFYNKDVSLWVMKNLQVDLVDEERKVMIGSDLFMITMKTSSEIEVMRLRMNIEY